MHAPTSSATRCWADLSAARRERVRLLVVDALALAAAGTAASDTRPVLAALAGLAPGDVRVPWTDLRLAAPQAATALSVLIHAWDYDDTHDEAVVHTASVVVPAALAAAATSDSQDAGSGAADAVLDGVTAGVQVLSRLARLAGPRVGVIRTAGLGAVAAAVTAATVWRLDDDAVQSAAALSLGSTLAPTTRQAVVDGSVAKRVQPGLAAAAGLTAASLARHGVVGPRGWLTGAFGVLPGAETTWEDLFRGDPELDDIALKPYPACRYTHAAVAAAAELRDTHPSLGDDDRVVAHLPAGAAYELVSRPYRDRGAPLVDAQFSLPWQLAAVWVTGRYDLTTLRHDLGRHDIAQVAARVEVRQDLPESTVMSGAEVELLGPGGRIGGARAEMPGSGDRALDRVSLDRKVRSCLDVAGVLDVPMGAADLWDLVDDLDGLDPARTTALVDRRTPAPPTDPAGV